MGKKQDLTSSEKDEMFVHLGKDYQHCNKPKTSSEIINNSTKVRTNGRRGIWKVTKRSKSVLVRKLKQNPLATSGKLFCEAGIQNCGPTLRCKILSTIGNIVQPVHQPPLSEVHTSKRVAWAKQYMKLDFRRVIFTDECRSTLDGPDGFCTGWLHTATEIPRRRRRQQGGRGVMFWAGIMYNKVVGQFRVPERVKIHSNSYQFFLRQNFELWFHGIPNAPSHAAKKSMSYLASIGIFGSRLMNWPPA